MNKLWFPVASCLCLLPLEAMAAPGDPAPADPNGILTLQGENDAFSVPGTDELYTSGLRIGYVTPTGVVPPVISSFGDQLLGAGTQRLEIDVQQVIYTPTDTQAYRPDPRDRPYAAHLSIDGQLISDTMGARSFVGLSLGVVGPDALGQSVQNGFHELIGDTPNRGWRYQLHNEPTLDISGGKIWRDDLGSAGPIDFQVLPQVTGQVGNTEIYGQGGAIFRFGQGLDSDYGPPTIQPTLSGLDAYTPTRHFAWYIFGGALGRVVAHDMLVQGNDFQSSAGVPLTPLQADVEVGAAAMLYGYRLSVVEVFETPEFHHSAPAFQYGSIALSARF
jgi:lipid A 3-O-deacylase